MLGSINCETRPVEQSRAARREAKTLLEKAKRAVEIAIEEGEERASSFWEPSTDVS